MSLINDRLQSDLLKGAQAAVEARITDEKTKEAYLNTVIAGMKVVAHNGDQGVQAFENAEDHVKACALGAANLVLLLRKQSNNRMPLEVIPPASISLMLQAMDMLDKSGIRKASTADIVRGTNIAIDRFMAALGMTPKKFNVLAKAVNGIVQDPQKMEMINRRAGVMKDPMASSPTVVPEARPVTRGKGLIDGI